jgi:uncharacterized protein YndB with AHSA1/START domain
MLATGVGACGKETRMPSAQHSVTINRPVDEVFAFLTNPENELQWRSSVKEIGAEGPVGVGTRIHHVVKGPGGIGIPADIEVTAYEPTTRYAFRGVAGPVRPVGEFLFTAHDQQTTVSFSLEVALTGIKKTLMSGQVQRSMDGEVTALEQAKVVLERS